MKGFVGILNGYVDLNLFFLKSNTPADTSLEYLGGFAFCVLRFVIVTEYYSY